MQLAVRFVKVEMIEKMNEKDTRGGTKLMFETEIVKSFSH